jgi:hypothetical protein
MYSSGSGSGSRFDHSRSRIATHATSAYTYNKPCVPPSVCELTSSVYITSTVLIINTHASLITLYNTPMCYNVAQQLTTLNNKNKTNSNSNSMKNNAKGATAKPLVSSDGKLPLEASGGAKPLQVHGKTGCIDTVPLEVNPFTDNACEEGYW